MFYANCGLEENAQPKIAQTSLLRLPLISVAHYGYLRAVIPVMLVLLPFQIVLTHLQVQSHQEPTRRREIIANSSRMTQLLLCLALT